MLVVAVELARAQLVQRAVEDGVPRHRADEGVVHPAARLQRRGEELVVVDHLVERAVALEVGVDVDAALVPEHLEPEDVRTLRGHAQPLVDLRAPQVRRQVLLRPEAVLPARVVAQPRLAVARELVRERLVAEPDLVEDPGYHEAQL
jgi:hypothetical protein